MIFYLVFRSDLKILVILHSNIILNLTLLTKKEYDN